MDEKLKQETKSSTELVVGLENSAHNNGSRPKLIDLNEESRQETEMAIFQTVNNLIESTVSNLSELQSNNYESRDNLLGNFVTDIDNDVVQPIDGQPVITDDSVPTIPPNSSSNLTKPATELKSGTAMVSNNKPDITSSASADSKQVESESTKSIQQTARETVTEKKKDDDKSGIYKALAIKLKKELVKSRDELKKFREDSQRECNSLKESVKLLESSLDSEKQTSATHEAKIKMLKQKLEVSENDLQQLQNDFENYKIRASQIMQSNNTLSKSSNNSFEEERYKQLKELNQVQQKRIENLEAQLSLVMTKNRELERDLELARKKFELVSVELNQSKSLGDKCELLSRENENLKLALKEFRSRLKEPDCDKKLNSTTATSKLNQEIEDNQKETTVDGKGTSITIDTNHANDVLITPTDSNTSSSYDGSTSGSYVHVSKPSTASELESQILTKMDHGDNNISLNEQVHALREEIRRLKKSTERLDLAENLEYLKNILLKFLTLDSSQNEQKQRLIPVLSTVLKLTPEETAKLQSTTQVDKLSMASSFFKL